MGANESRCMEPKTQTMGYREPSGELEMKQTMGDSEHSGELDKKEKLLEALQHDEYNIFSEIISQTNPNPWCDEPYLSSLLEISCQIKNRKKFVKLLLDNGAEPNIKNHFTGMPLIHATAENGNFDVLKLLLTEPKIDASVTDNNNRTILHCLAGVSGKEPGDKEGIYSCFKLVLNSCKNEIIDWQDKKGNTALYIAVKSEFQGGVLLLLKRGADIMFSIHGTPILSSVSAPMLKAILDNCNPERSEDVKLTFSYEVLKKIISYMAECPHQRELLKHPVTSRFINLHDEHITIHILLNIVLYLIPLLIQTYASLFPGQEQFFLFLWEGIFLSVFLVYSWRLEIKYFCTWEKFLSLPRFIYFVGLGFDVLKNSFIWPHMLVISFILAWLRLVVMTGRLPLVAVQMEMFKRVSWGFFRYMAGYSILLLTLALTSLISSKQDGDSVISVLSQVVLKTIEIFTGNYIDIQFDNLPGTSHVTFLLIFFLILITMGLSYELAVGDIQELKKETETLIIVARVRRIMAINIHYIS